MIGLDRNVLPLGTAMVRTTAVDLMLACAAGTFDDGFIVAVDGPPGCGKTTALTALTGSYDGTWSAVSLAPASSDKDVVAQVHAAVVGGEPGARVRRVDLLAELRFALARQRRLLVVDEAQNSGLRALQMLRHLHMDPTACFDLVLCGAGLERKLAAEPMLHNRIGQWARFEPVPASYLPGVLAAMHPLFGTADPDDLVSADDQHCRGVLRMWVKVLGILLRLSPGGDPVTFDRLEQAITLLTGRPTQLSA